MYVITMRWKPLTFCCACARKPVSIRAALFSSDKKKKEKKDFSSDSWWVANPFYQ